ncbi:uncharacterized protein [Anabrus simplex]|uniref:uncharacterized protein n=1 Tax=Anabrus simplex TaxID=316456 RepID=UPI0035A39D0F
MIFGALILTISALCFTTVSGGSTKLAGPYELHFRRIEHCADEGTKEFDYDTKMNKVGKYEYAYNGKAKIPDNTQLDLALDGTAYKKMQSGQWAKTYNYKLENLCEEIQKYFPDSFQKYTEEYMKVENKCPVPGGLYKAENWTVYIQQLPMDQLEYGIYKVEAVVLRKEERLGCIELYLDVEEKASEINYG